MLTLFSALAFLTGLAEAQDAVSDVDAQIYRVPIDARYTLWTDDAENLDSGTLTARLGLIYTRMPLIYVVEDAEGNETSATTILDRAFQVDAIAGYTLGRARLGVDLPVFLDTAGTGFAGGVLSYEPWPEKEERAVAAEDILVHLRIEDPQGNPVPGVRTEVALPEGPETGGDALDFEVPPGRYRMWADADGYRSIQSLVTVQPSPPEQEIVKVMEALAGRVVVRVRDIDDNPVAASFTMDGGEPIQAPGGEGSTDAPPGEHAFVVTAPDYQPVRATAEVQAGQTTVILVTLPKFIRPGEGKLYLLDKVHFDFDKATIQPRSYRLLAEVARFIDDNPQVGRIRIEGHTDTMGSRAYNKDLSQRRARAVYDYLTVTLGVPPARLDPPIGCGEDFNIEKLGDEVRSEANRRVEFIFAAKHPEACIAVTESPAEAPGGPVPTADQP